MGLRDLFSRDTVPTTSTPPALRSLPELRAEFERYVAEEVAAAPPDEYLRYDQGLAFGKSLDIPSSAVTEEQGAALLAADPSLAAVTDADLSLLHERSGLGATRVLLADIGEQLGLDLDWRRMPAADGADNYPSNTTKIGPALKESDTTLTWAELEAAHPGYVAAALGLEDTSPAAIAAALYPARMHAFLWELNAAHPLVAAHNDSVSRARDLAQAERPDLAALDSAAGPVAASPAPELEL
jgi:hypothetical protein